MPYTVVSARVEYHAKCSRCGHEFHGEADGDEVLGEAFTLYSLQCEKCGLELTQGYDMDDDDDALDHEEDYDDDYEEDDE